MQRLFSAFPDGWPGVGLLVLRIVVGATAAVQGVAHLVASGSPSPATWCMGGLAIASGALVFVGFLTPGTGTILGLSIALFWYLPRAAGAYLDGMGTMLMVADAAAIALLGPGAFSVDALLFGRREILIPRESPARRPEIGDIQ